MKGNPNIVYIYTLSDPITNEVKYVGKTIQNPNTRLRHHLSVAKRGVKYYLYNWIRKLLDENNIPKIEVIEICNKENWEDREKYWIKKFDNLCNFKEGGQWGRCLHVYKWSDKSRINYMTSIRNRKFPFVLLDKYGNLIKEYPNSRILSEEENISVRKIGLYSQKMNLYRNKYYIIRKRDENKFKEIIKLKNRKIILTKNGIIYNFVTKRAAAKFLGITSSALCTHMNLDVKYRTKNNKLVKYNIHYDCLP